MCVITAFHTKLSLVRTYLMLKIPTCLRSHVPASASLRWLQVQQYWIAAYANRQPSAIDFEVASIADLILDAGFKAAVQAEIDSRIQVSKVTSTALALASRHVGVFRGSKVYRW